MDKLASLEAFEKVAELGGFAAAARELGLSRSRVNRMVISLEDELGSNLLNRTTRRVTLTPVGEAFLTRVRQILRDVKEAENLVRETSADAQGELRINAPMSFGTRHLSPAIARFMLAYPQVEVQVLLDDRFLDPVSEGFDITVRVGELQDSPTLIEQTICEVRRRLYAAPSYLEAAPELTSLHDLSRHSCLHYGSLPGGHTWVLNEKSDDWQRVRVTGKLCCNNAEVLRDAAAQGLGIALLPDFIAEPAVCRGHLIPVLPAVRARPIHLTLVYPPGRHMPAKTSAFIRFMYAEFDQPL